MSTIVLTDVNDRLFARIAQNAKVNGCTFPSGLKIPEKGEWYIRGEVVHNVAVNNPE